MMNRLATMPMESKQWILLVIIILIAAVNIFLSLAFLSPKQTSEQVQLYKEACVNHIERFKPIQSKFYEFSFYQTYDKLVLENKQINEEYRDGVNKFSNISQPEFYSLFLFISTIAKNRNFGEISKYYYDYFDWSRRDAVIRDQRGFNTSFIFAALTSLEYQINANHTVGSQELWITLSAQEIIDCCPECMKIRKPESVFEYMKQNGVTIEKLYPYENNIFDQNPKACRRDQFQSIRYYVEKYRSIKGCALLQTYLNRGPLVVSVDARKFNSYIYGIFNNCERKRTHYSAIVGINYNSWKLQNSWGRKWGENGYVRIGAGDTCGVCLHPSVATLKKPQ